MQKIREVANMKVQIKQEGAITKVLLDEQDVTSRLTNVDVELKAGYIPVVKLEVLPDEIENVGEFDVFKKVKEEKKQENAQTGINISIHSEQSSGLIEYLAKCIIMYQHEMKKTNRCQRHRQH